MTINPPKILPLEIGSPKNKLALIIVRSTLRLVNGYALDKGITRMTASHKRVCSTRNPQPM